MTAHVSARPSPPRCSQVASSPPRAEVVILKDGFVIQGNVHKEIEVIIDKPSGRPIQIIKANGFDMIDEGPKVTIFSTHAKQLGAVGARHETAADYKATKCRFPAANRHTRCPSAEYDQDQRVQLEVDPAVSREGGRGPRRK